MTHQFSDYLRVKANTLTDVGQKAILNIVADAFDEFEKQSFLASETSVVPDAPDPNAPKVTSDTDKVTKPTPIH